MTRARTLSFVLNQLAEFVLTLKHFDEILCYIETEIDLSGLCIGSARLKKIRFQSKLKDEQQKEIELKKRIDKHDKEIPIIMGVIDNLVDEIDRQNTKCQQVKQMMKEYEVPTVDVYIELKLSLERIERREDQMLRKQVIDRLKTTNDKQMRARQQKIRRPPSKLSRKPTKNFTIPGRLYHGKTFNIVYKPEIMKKTSN